MRELDYLKKHHLPKSQRTDFTRDELLDILDFYLQYKPCFENQVSDEFYLTYMVPHDFTLLLYEYQIVDLNYFENLDKMRKKYNKHDISDLAKEKLDFFEVITIFTFIHRAERHGGGWYKSCVKDNTYYNLLLSLKEIRDDLLKE